MLLYDRISKDNVKKYGTENEKVLQIIINQYSDRTHFLYEIIQNAEDAGATYIKFQLENDQFVIFHNGRPFNEKDIEGVCGIANGTKTDGTRIGHFGIGFKSVYCYTDKPLIYSGDYHFAINNRLFPKEIPPRKNLAVYETCILLPFDKEDVPSQTAYTEIRFALTTKIKAESILMLNNISEISIKIEGCKNTIDISKRKYSLDNVYPENVFSLSVQTTINNQINGKKESHDKDYLYFTDSESEATAIIFLVDGKELKPIKNSKIYAFFPTAKEAHQNFYIHAPFDTTPARDNFKEGADYGKHNIRLVRNIGNLICFAFCWMKDHHYLSPSSFRNTFPIYQYDTDDVLYPLYENSIEMIQEEAILPTSDSGVFKNLKDICVPKSSGIVDTFSTDDLRHLLQRRNLSWLAKQFTTDGYRDVYAFLKANFALKTVDWKELVMNLDAPFLQKKSLNWFEKLMSKIETFCMKQSSNDSRYIDISQIPFVRTTDRKQICARDDEGRLQVYLNNPDVAKSKIDFSFLKNESIRSFYERALQIPKYDVQQETLENILPKYAERNPTFKSKSPLKENIEDLKTIKDAISVNPALKEEVAACFVVTDGKKWYRPSELYIESGDIRTGYSLVKDIITLRYLWKGYLNGSFSTMRLDENFFKTIGCNYGICTIHVTEDEYLRAVRKYIGLQMYYDLQRKYFEKTYKSKKLDWSFNYDGFPIVFENMTKEKSVAIARFLNPHVDKFTIQGELVGADDKYFSGKNVDSIAAYSMLGLQLCFSNWIYIENDSNPHSPLEIDKNNIIKEYRVAKRLIDALPFKEVENAISEWISETIGNKGDAELVKKLFSDPDALVKMAKANANRKARDAAKTEQRKSIKDMLEKSDRKQQEHEKHSDTFEITPISKKALEKREKKLDEAFAESLDHFTQLDRGIYFGRRASNKEERIFLQNEYGGICQICQKKIIKYDGSPYFEAINIIKFNKLPERLSASSNLGWNSLSLCPNCAVEYNYCSKKISTMYSQITGKQINPDDEEPIEISIEMPEGRNRYVKYSPRHFLALKRALEIFKEEKDV